MDAKLTGPKPKEDAARRSKPRRANTTDPHSPRSLLRRIEGRDPGLRRTSCCDGQSDRGREVAGDDQSHFVPVATAVTENLTDAGHVDGVGTFVADAGWTAANGTTDVGAEVLIATRKSSWREADEHDDDKLAVLARVNRGELYHRWTARSSSISYSWVGDMTEKRYFGTDGQRITRSAEPEPDEWIPVIERVDRGEISKRAAQNELTGMTPGSSRCWPTSRGEATDPSIARKAMDDKLAEPLRTPELYRRRSTTIEPVFGNVKANLGYRRFARRRTERVATDVHVHNLLKLQRPPPDQRAGRPPCSPPIRSTARGESSSHSGTRLDGRVPVVQWGRRGRRGRDRDVVNRLGSRGTGRSDLARSPGRGSGGVGRGR